MNKIIAIAINTLRESVRDRVFYSLLIFAILMLCFSTVLGQLTVGDHVKIVKDFGLGAISLFGTLIAIFVGIGLVYKEMEKKTIYIILSKPLARWQFLLGKYCGLSLTLLIEVSVMTTCLLGLCFFYTQNIPWDLFKAIIPIWFEMQLILAVALMFSTLASPFLSGLFALSFFIIGHLTQDLKMLAEQAEDATFTVLADILYYSFPNLEKLNFKAQVVHGLAINPQQIYYSLFYSATYTIAVLFVAILIFRNRDIR
jgi:ABC-type transport system involved in multi-copper enzyme maturation permease subunit